MANLKRNSESASFLAPVIRLPRSARKEAPTAVQTEFPIMVEPAVVSTELSKPQNIFSFLWQIFKTCSAKFLEASCWLGRSAFEYLKLHPTHAAMNIIFVSLLGLVLVTGARLYDHVLVAKISDQTIDKLIQASRFTRSYETEDVIQRNADELLKVGAPRWAQREGIKAVLLGARRAGLSMHDQAVLLATVEIESGFNPMARAQSSTACGLFQFVRGTGAQYGLNPSDCMDPWLNAQAGIEHYRENYSNRIAAKVENMTGPERLVKTFELSYYLHHDGAFSTSPAADVKLIVLDALPFLLRAYNILEEETQADQYAPSFLSVFADEFSRVSAVVGYRLGQTLGM